MISQLTVFLANEKGRLAAACRTLADADINMKALFIADTADFGIVRIFCDTPKRAVEVLGQAGFRASLTPVIAVSVEDAPGTLADLLGFCQGASMNIEYGYCFCTADGKAVDVLKIEGDGAEAVLAEAFWLRKRFTALTLLSPIENGSAHQSGARLSRRALGFALALLLALPLGAPARAFADVRGTDEILGASVEARGLPAVACPNITATFALVMDDEGTVLFSRGALERSHIASITKIMTAIVALDSGVPLDSTVTVSQEAASVGESSASLWAGDTLTLEAALAGLMIPSGNDAAIAIAETLGEGMKTDDSQTANEAFVAAMNAKAAELGMTETLFSNPHGLDIGAYDNEMYSCARDVALMSAYAMENETFRSIVSKESAQITVTRADGKPQVIDLQSTDRLLGTYEGACGIKTGYTEAAGNSFAGACDRGDGLLYAIVLGSPSEDARFQDTETLFNWVYDNRVSYALAHSPETVASAADGGAEVPLIARVSHSAWPDRTVAATFADPSAAVEVFAPEGNVSQEIVAEELTGSVAAGDVVGVANFYQGNELVASQDLIACEDSPAPGFLEGIGIWWNRLWGNDAPAPTEVVNETPLIYSKSSSREDHQSVAAIAAGVSDDAPADGAPSGAGAGAADAANE